MRFVGSDRGAGGAGRQSAGRDGGRHSSGMRESGTAAARLVVDYVKQETLQPLRGLGRFMVFGIAGSIAVAAGVVLLLIGVLRILQTETGAFHGNLSWVPYLIVLALAGVVIGLAGWRIVSGPARRRLPAHERDRD